MILAIEVVALYLEWIVIRMLHCSVDTDCLFVLPYIAVTILMIAINSKKAIVHADVLRKLSTINYCFHGSLAGQIWVIVQFSSCKFINAIVLFVVTECAVFLFGILVIRWEEKSPWLRYLH